MYSAVRLSIASLKKRYCYYYYMDWPMFQLKLSLWIIKWTNCNTMPPMSEIIYSVQVVSDFSSLLVLT